MDNPEIRIRHSETLVGECLVPARPSVDPVRSVLGFMLVLTGF